MLGFLNKMQVTQIVQFSGTEEPVGNPSRPTEALEAGKLVLTASKDRSLKTAIPPCKILCTCSNSLSVNVKIPLILQILFSKFLSAQPFTHHAAPLSAILTLSIFTNKKKRREREREKKKLVFEERTPYNLVT
jgi:hypothetical protein